MSLRRHNALSEIINMVVLTVCAMAGEDIRNDCRIGYRGWSGVLGNMRFSYVYLKVSAYTRGFRKKSLQHAVYMSYEKKRKRDRRYGACCPVRIHSFVIVADITQGAGTSLLVMSDFHISHMILRV